MPRDLELERRPCRLEMAGSGSRKCALWWEQPDGTLLAPGGERMTEEAFFSRYPPGTLGVIILNHTDGCFEARPRTSPRPAKIAGTGSIGNERPLSVESRMNQRTSLARACKRVPRFRNAVSASKAPTGTSARPRPRKSFDGVCRNHRRRPATAMVVDKIWWSPRRCDQRDRSSYH
jgi:hypothetical protein